MITQTDGGVCSIAVEPSDITVTTPDCATVNLSINKEIINTGDAPYDSGDVIQYRITVSNTGTKDATGVVVTDTYESAEVAYSSMTSGSTPDTST